jgi:hypothetical protein
VYLNVVCTYLLILGILSIRIKCKVDEVKSCEKFDLLIYFYVFVMTFFGNYFLNNLGHFCRYLNRE